MIRTIIYFLLVVSSALCCVQIKQLNVGNMGVLNDEFSTYDELTATIDVDSGKNTG